jgi:hypothetical protein
MPSFVKLRSLVQDLLGERGDLHEHTTHAHTDACTQTLQYHRSILSYKARRVERKKRYI